MNPTPTSAKRRTHRTASQWQILIDDYHLSGLSGPRFCKARDLGYASFCKWRQRLTCSAEQHHANTATAVAAPAPSFIDLTTLAGSREPSWNIVLKLGNGIELCLSQTDVSA